MTGVGLERDLTRNVIDARASTGHHLRATIPLATGSQCPEMPGVGLKRDLTAVIDARAGTRHHPRASIARVATLVIRCPEMGAARCRERDHTPKIDART